MEQVTVKGIPVMFEKTLMGCIRYSELGQGCVLCSKQLQSEDSVFLVTTNDKLFPDCFIHESCMCPPPAPFDKNNHFAWAAYKANDLWNEAQKYRFWF